jgi:hypothetical protein
MIEIHGLIASHICDICKKAVGGSKLGTAPPEWDNFYMCQFCRESLKQLIELKNKLK